MDSILYAAVNDVAIGGRVWTKDVTERYLADRNADAVAIGVPARELASYLLVPGAPDFFKAVRIYR